MNVESRYQPQLQQHRQQHQQHQQERLSALSNNDVIYSTGSVWLSGLKRRPTAYLPNGLAEKFNIHKPCRIAIIDNGNGILLKFLHPIVRHRQQNKQEHEGI